MSNGRRRAEKPPRKGVGSWPYLAAHLLGSVVCAGAWVFLVGAAIDFGHAARGGRSIAWAFTGGATLGAIVCMLLLFGLVARTRETLRVAARPRPRRPSGGRRAAR